MTEKTVVYPAEGTEFVETTQEQDNVLEHASSPDSPGSPRRSAGFPLIVAAFGEGSGLQRDGRQGRVHYHVYVAQLLLGLCKSVENRGDVFEKLIPLADRQLGNARLAVPVGIIQHAIPFE